MRKALATILVSTAAAVTLWVPGAGARTWEDGVRAATARFHSVEQAEAAGYHVDPFCVSSPAGVMGFHAVKVSAIDMTLRAEEPEVLLYVPKANGSLRLAGVEYLIPDADQNLATDGDRPSIFGQAFDGPMPGHGPGQPVHYDLHVWVWQDNPQGVFTQFNPALSCSP